MICVSILKWSFRITRTTKHTHSYTRQISTALTWRFRLCFDFDERAGSKRFTNKGSDKAARREHRRMVKEAKREKRKVKIPKSVKRRHKKVNNKKKR